MSLSTFSPLHCRGRRFSTNLCYGTSKHFSCRGNSQQDHTYPLIFKHKTRLAANYSDNELLHLTRLSASAFFRSLHFLLFPSDISTTYLATYPFVRERCVGWTSPTWCGHSQPLSGKRRPSHLPTFFHILLEEITIAHTCSTASPSAVRN
ncbi:hypothetical protein BGW80DRAFT_373872 [Lactifluus volemus]|nr:hypothetical protein BGW80DRAFT_373872 [Lactifluus volemus]